MAKKKSDTKSVQLVNTKQEQEVIQLVGNGLSNQDVADQMGLELSEVVNITKRPAVKEAIRELQKEVMKQFGDSKQQIATMMKTILLTDITELYDDNGKMKPFDDIPLHLRQSITSLEFKHGTDSMGMPITNTKVTVMDKMKAIEILARMEGLFSEKPDKGGMEFKIGYE